MRRGVVEIETVDLPDRMEHQTTGSVGGSYSDIRFHVGETRLRFFLRRDVTPYQTGEVAQAVVFADRLRKIADAIEQGLDAFVGESS